MTLEQLRIFIAVAEREHITRAADALHLTQSAVSSAVTALEAGYGLTLFDRVGRRIVLNQNGQAFLPEAKAVIARAKAAAAALADLSNLSRGQLSIMASQTIGSYWLPRRLVAYRQKFPGIEISVALTNTERVADGIESGTAEIGLVEGVVDRGSLSSAAIATDEMSIVVGRNHPWYGRVALTDADLLAAKWVVREPGAGTRGAFDAMMKSHGLYGAELSIAAVLPDLEAILGTVEAGFEATLVSLSASASRVAAGTVFAIPSPVWRRSFYLLRHKERYRTKAAEAFVTTLT